MWYFAWILGLGLASTFGVLNAIWYDVVETRRETGNSGGPDGPPERSGKARTQ
jgi:cyd operon protein YbgT